MLKTLFGEVRNGRLKRLQYVGYSLLLTLLMMGVGLAIAMSIGLAEDVIGGDLQQSRDILRERFTLPYIVVFAAATLLFIFSGANIMAKRIRDIGLPGWWSVLALLVLFAILASVIPDQVTSGLQSLVWIVLSLIPGNALARGTQQTR